MATDKNKKILDKNVINFFSRKKDYRSLSNFWEKDVSIFRDVEFMKAENTVFTEKIYSSWKFM